MDIPQFYDETGDPLDMKRVIGYGAVGVVFRVDLRELTGYEYALKVPRIDEDTTQEKLENRIRAFRREQRIYERLWNAPTMETDCILQCLEFEDTQTWFFLMRNGDLFNFVSRHRVFTHRALLIWFRQMARAVVQVHAQNVMVADIALRNFLLDDDFLPVMFDFTHAIMFDENLGSIEEENHKGRTVRTDLGELAAAMYPIITGQPCTFDVHRGQSQPGGIARWPKRPDLPNTKGVWLGSVLEKCFTQGFRNASELLQALEEYPEDGEPDSRIQRIWKWTRSTLAKHSVPALMCFGAMAMFARWTLGLHRHRIPPWNIMLYEH